MKEGAGLPSQSYPAGEGVRRSAVPDHVIGKLRAVQAALGRQHWSDAEDLAGRALDDGLMPIRLTQIFSAAGKPELLLRAAWNRRDALFSQLRNVAWFARLVSGTADADQYIGMLRQWALENVTRPVAFGLHDYLKAHEKLDRRAHAALFCLKHGAYALEASGDVLQKAARFAGRFDIAPETMEFFYSHRADRNIERAVWLSRFKTAQVQYHALSDAVEARRFRQDPDPAFRRMAFRFCRIASLTKYLDADEARRRFEGFDRSRGLLLCTFHGGFVRISNALFASYMPDAYWVTRQSKGKVASNAIFVRDSERAAAFRAYKALTQGKAVVMAPDGSHYGESSGVEVDILGLKTKISEGAAVLAYESKCDTGWISAVRRGDKYVPDYLPGPRRLEGETYKAFRDRWLSFYVGCIERAFTSSPDNLVPISRWASPGNKWWA